MPSPLFHSATGYFLSKFLPFKWIPNCHQPRSFTLHVAYPVFVAIAADFDLIPQILTGESLHRGITHSLIFTLGFSVIAGWIGSRIWKTSYQSLFRFTLILYSSHLILDFFSEGRGIKVFLPFIDQFFKSPIILFPGIHFSRGWLHPSHILPLSYELLLSAVLLGLLNTWQKYKIRKKALYYAQNNINPYDIRPLKEDLENSDSSL